jgi:hypothetical protein
VQNQGRRKFVQNKKISIQKILRENGVAGGIVINQISPV